MRLTRAVMLGLGIGITALVLIQPGRVQNLEVSTGKPVLVVEPAGPDFRVLLEEEAELNQRETEAAELAAAQAAADEARAQTAPSPSPPSIVAAGRCCTHTDEWWRGVAQCEQGGRNDPYYGYFSFMDGSQGGRSWDEQVAAGNALLASVGHEVGPWAESCVRMGYQFSPSG